MYDLNKCVNEYINTALKTLLISFQTKNNWTKFFSIKFLWLLHTKFKKFRVWSHFHKKISTIFGQNAFFSRYRKLWNARIFYLLTLSLLGQFLPRKTADRYRNAVSAEKFKWIAIRLIAFLLCDITTNRHASPCKHYMRALT